MEIYHDGVKMWKGVVRSGNEATEVKFMEGFQFPQVSDKKNVEITEVKEEKTNIWIDKAQKKITNLDLQKKKPQISSL